MSDLNIRILDLIDKKYTINEMMHELNLSREQLCKAFRKMKQVGIRFNRKYYDCGEIVCSLNKELYIPTKIEHVNIITEPGTDSIRLILTSDLHIGSEFQNLDAINKIYEYCAINNIHIIVIAGDFLDGIKIGKAKAKMHSNPIEQMEYAYKSYPYDEHILNFLTLGNHDIDSLISYGVDFAENLRAFRHDVIPVGYGRGIINIKNDRIIVAHPLGIGVSNEHDLSSNYLLVKGHSHATKSIISANGNCSLTVPSLSNVFLSENEFLPGAIDLTIKFKNGYFDTVYYEHLLVSDKVFAVSSTQYFVDHDKERNFDGTIKYEEDLSKIKKKKRK